MAGSAYGRDVVATITIMLATGQKPLGTRRTAPVGGRARHARARRRARCAGALDAARAHRPDVALLDREIPPAGSLALARDLRQAHPATRILLVEEQADDAFAVGVVG